MLHFEAGQAVLLQQSSKLPILVGKWQIHPVELFYLELSLTIDHLQ